MRLFLILLMLFLLFIPSCSTTTQTIIEKYKNNTCETMPEDKLKCTFFCPVEYKTESITKAGEVICKKEKKNELVPYYFLD